MADVIVLIPHYNNLDGLYKTLASISNIEPVDVLIIDGVSIIKPDQKYLKETFPDINDVIVININKLGIEHALNVGLQYIVNSKKYTYVARLDCKDTCSPDRFSVQKRFLIENPDICLVGSYVWWIDKYNNHISPYKLPLSHKEIVKTHYFKDPFIHPAIMFRVDALNITGFYPTKYPYCEDSGFFHNFIMHLKTANIPLFLVNILLDPDGVTQGKYRKQKLSRLKFSLNIFTFRYFFSCIYGILKNLALLILGNKIPTKFAIFINKKNS